VPANPNPVESGIPPRRVALVVGTTAGGTGAHVRMLAAGLAGRGVAVSVLGPSSAGARFGFGALGGVAFSPVEFGDRPRVSDVAAAARLRRALLSTGGPCVVHAHGLRAGALTVLALGWVRGRRRPGLVVTVHNAPPAGGGVPALIYRVLERVVARRAVLVLCVSPDLEARMRAAGARRVARAVVPAADRPASPDAGSSSVTAPIPATASASVTASAHATSCIPDTSGSGRPVVFAAGRLVAQKGLGTLLEAAARWRDLEPEPLLAIAGDGPLAGELRARAAALGVDAVFLGHRDDVPALLAAAAVVAVPSQWEGQPLIVQEALRAGAVIVATRVGGIPDLVGTDAALLVEPGDAAGLAAAVRAVLTNPPLAARCRAAASGRAAALPAEDDAITAAVTSYAAVARRGGHACQKVKRPGLFARLGTRK